MPKLSDYFEAPNKNVGMYAIGSDFHTPTFAERFSGLPRGLTSPTEARTPDDLRGPGGFRSIIQWPGEEHDFGGGMLHKAPFDPASDPTKYLPINDARNRDPRSGNPPLAFEGGPRGAAGGSASGEPVIAPDYSPRDILSKIQESLSQGKSYTEVGKEHGLSKDQVSGIARRNGWKSQVPAGSLPRGAIGGSPEKMQQLRDLLAQGKSFSEIARELNVSKNTVAGSAWRDNMQSQNPAGYSSRAPSMPRFNLPTAEDIDPREMIDYLKTFGGR